MDRATAAIYERHGEKWAAVRGPKRRTAAQAFARSLANRLEPGAVVADLGCGPGWYAGDMPSPVVALEVAFSMLQMVAAVAPGAWRVQADLEALPFRRKALGAAWAANSYVHVARTAMPLALADLHRSLVTGAPVEIRLFSGDFEGHNYPGDDLPGRFFSSWTAPHLSDVVVGAGFDVEELTTWGEPDRDHGFTVRASPARTLPDYVGPDLRLLLVGLNPSLYAADAGVGFARPGNRFWPAALAARLVSRDRDPRHALIHHGIGFSDLVKRATPGAAELTAAEYVAGFARVERLVRWLQPGAVCFLGVSGFRAAADSDAVAGPQPNGVGGRPVYVMPNPSGANAHAGLDDLVAHLGAASALAG